MDAGMVPADIPWSNPDFQYALISRMQDFRRYKADADKLAIIKEIFGGAK